MASLTPVVPDFEIKKLLSLSSGEDKWVSMSKEQLFDG